MRSYTTPILLLLALLIGAAPQAFGQSAPTPGNCTSPRAERDLDVNNVLARMFNTGSLFFGNATTNAEGYLVPQASGNSPIFASGIWIGGRVNGQLRVAGSTYDRFEFWAGPLNDDGTLPDPTCQGANGIEFDKIWRVSRADIIDLDGGAGAAPDLASWPVSLGAPALAALDNGFDDDGDGLIDEGTDGIDNDGDGFIDERDEQERIVPSVREAAGRPIYDPAGGDRPEIIGDQAVWWVMNDLGNTHQKSLTPPIGVEVQVLAWSFARADALNDVTFYRYTVTKKTPGDMEDTYLTLFSDPDLGDANDDFVGIDTTLSMGYVYNDGPTDDVYGTAPALGYDFFQGPIVDLDGDGEATDTLGTTTFMYFINGVAFPVADPANGEQMYFNMQGRWADGTPMTEGGDGYQTGGPVTKFAFPGDPVAGTGWNEVTEGNTGGDRRFLVTTGPFTLESGVSQDIVFGIVFGQAAAGDNAHLESIEALRAADRLAQTAYDIDFELPSAPPAPPLCNANSANPELLPGSGHCLEGVEVNGQAALVWGYPSNSSNYLGSYETPDFLLAGQGAVDSTYNFEGFQVYRYPNANFDDTQRQLVATYDVINGITQVIDEAFDPVIGDLVPFVAVEGTDSGIQYSYVPTGLTNYTDYYFGVTAYAVNLESVPKVIESAPTKITVRPADVVAGGGGSVQQANLGDQLVAVQNEGIGRASVFAQVVDPTKITGATYTVEIFEFTPEEGGDSVLTFRILRGGEVVFDGQTQYDETGVIVDINEERTQLTQNVVIDGISFFAYNPPDVPDVDLYTADGELLNFGTAIFAGGAAAYGVVETSTAGDVGPCEGVPTNPAQPGYDPGCISYGGNSVINNPNRTGDYLLTSPTTVSALIQGDVIFGDDFEMRFTEECATAGNCLGAYFRDNGEIASVPFELWNVRDVRNPDDDVRMIPLLRTTGSAPVENWDDTFTGEATFVLSGDTLALGITERVYFMMPDRPDGYELFEAAARNFGGPGAIYDRANDADTQIDTTAIGTDCSQQGAFVDFCYLSVAPWRAPIGGAASAGVQVADVSMDGTTPGAGTTILFRTAPKAILTEGDTFVFDTAEFAFLTDNAETAEEALDRIGVVPNPYMGVSSYESNNLDRVVRFINLPDQATIRIYTVAGTLIRTLQKDGPSRSLDWDLNTHNNLPVASGMYLIHVDVPGVGEKVLKFGVVNRKNRITIF